MAYGTASAHKTARRRHDARHTLIFCDFSISSHHSYRLYNYALVGHTARIDTGFGLSMPQESLSRLLSSKCIYRRHAALYFHASRDRMMTTSQKLHYATRHAGSESYFTITLIGLNTASYAN